MTTQRTPEELVALGKKLKDGTATTAERLEVLEAMNAALKDLNRAMSGVV